MNRVSRITGGVIKHRLLDKVRDEYIPMCKDASDGMVILLVGPTQCAKSIVFHEVVTTLNASFKDPRPGSMPVVDLQMETVSEGRTKTKWLGIELLKALGHPVYKHIGAMDEADHYMPSKGRDEATIRIALKEALSARFTRRTCLDEAHLLTRTKDPELRAAILESIKSTCAIDRSLIACGGYEIAYKGLFDSSHFCGRVTTYDFGCYRVTSRDDLEAWCRILRTYSDYLDLEKKSVLLDHAPELLHWNNGTVGLLDKHLWACQKRAAANHIPIDIKVLRDCSPPEKERAAIALDIKKGQAALLSSASFDMPSPSEEVAMKSSSPSARGQKVHGTARRAFERNPNRNAAADVVLHDSD